MKLNVKIGLTTHNVEVLFIVNNNDSTNKNYSILGVFDTPERARNAVESQTEKIIAAGHEVPHMSMKCVVLNGGAYQGYRTYPTDEYTTTEKSLSQNMNIHMSLRSFEELEDRLNEKYKL